MHTLSLTAESTGHLLKVLRGLQVALDDCDDSPNSDSDSDRSSFWQRAEEIFGILDERPMPIEQRGSLEEFRREYAQRRAVREDAMAKVNCAICAAAAFRAEMLQCQF